MPDKARVAPTRPVERTHHDDTDTDEYDWLRDRDDPEVAAYLTAENDWGEQHPENRRRPADPAEDRAGGRARRVTGRYSQWEDAALRMAWLMDQLNVDGLRTSDDDAEAE